MKFLRTKWYLYKITGEGTGIVRDKPLNAKMDGTLILENHRHTYVGWKVEKGSRLAAKEMAWGVI